MKPYYYIYRPGYSQPTVKHSSLNKAQEESLRLAAKHPGAQFEILQCVAITMTTTPRTFWMDGVDPSNEEGGQ